MSSMVSRWPVLLPLPVGSGDVDPDGRLTAAAVERLFAAAREAYVAGGATLAGRTIDVVEVSVAPGDARVADEVTVSVSVVEVFADRFSMNVRVRPAAGEGVAAHGWCTLVPDGGVTREVRDELIARAHAAEHYH